LDPQVYYVIRQRGGWGVEWGGKVRSGHKSRDGAIAKAREAAAHASKKGHDCCLRIQEEAGAWREERSFSAD
jgi:hypothetical protein